MLAEERMVPVTVPLAEIVRPGGRLVAENVRASLSGSEKDEATDRLTTEEIPEDRLGNVPATGFRLGAVTVQVKDPVTEPPRPSLAVIRVVNGLEAVAVLAIIPEISPAEEIDRPVGSPVAVKESVSESGSENAPAAENETCVPEVLDRLVRDEKTGGRLELGSAE